MSDHKSAHGRLLHHMEQARLRHKETDAAHRKLLAEVERVRAQRLVQPPKEK